MQFYKVWVSSQSFHGKEALTYSSENSYAKGAVVQVPLQNKLVAGIIAEKTIKPSFKTKNIINLPQPLYVPEQHLAVIEWLAAYYPAPMGQIVSLLIPTNIAQKSRQEIKIQSKNKTTIPKLPPLTKDQEAALKNIISSDQSSFLLHGDTGTGKTRVYLELVRKVFVKGKSAIILTPEISLTPQLVKTFEAQFPDQTVVVHSQLTPAENRNAWMRIASSDKPTVVIGPRSALFSPLKKVGLVILDEAHDQAYKQEQSPHYQTSRVAAYLAKLHGATFILGSGTPNVADYYTFETKHLPIIRMTETATAVDTSEAKLNIISIRDRDNFTRSPWLSNPLIDHVRKAISNGEQSLIFLNRRGSARVVLCQNCGWQALCPRCDVPLTYHGDNHSLLCHTCGHREVSPTSCPSCKSPDILYKSAGTKAIELEISRLFPDAKVARFDSDNLKSERFDQNHTQVSEGDIDILVGTQTLTKGLDLPKLSVVGVIAADTALHFPDYTAEEITYQQLIQVAGRVGRGHRAGNVIIQTNYPENMVIKAIENKNYSLFYKQQISEREKFLYPPFSYILKLTCCRKTSASAEKTLRNLHTFITKLPLSVNIIGPSPSFKEKQNNSYYWQMIIKAKKRDQLIHIINQLPANVSYDIDPSNLL